MSEATSEAVLPDEKSLTTPQLSLTEWPVEIQREKFNMAPHPFAIMLGATTTLLLVATLRTLWLLITG